MWEPWEGAQYAKYRTLILGESCYDWDADGVRYEPKPDHPCMIVRESVEAPHKGASTMRKLTRAICGTAKPTSAQSIEAWNRFAFTNYIPVSVGHGAARRPGSTAWKSAEEEWPALLSRLRPRIVIVLGLIMWSHMPETQEFINDDVQGYIFPGGGGLAMCRAVPHPSRGPSWTKYAEMIRKALNAEWT